MASKKPQNDDTGVSSSPRPPSTTTDTHPLNNIIIGKKKSSNLTNLTNLTNDKLIRVNTSFYLSADLNREWRRYCRLSDKDGCWILEEALLEYMRSHPVSQVTLNVTQDLAAYAPDLQTRLRNKILRDKISSLMDLIRRIQETGRGDADSFRKQLQKLILQATKMRRPDQELLDLLKEAEYLI